MNRSTVPDRIDGAHQLEFLVDRQIPQIDSAKSPEYEQEPDGLGVFRVRIASRLKSAQYGFGTPVPDTGVRIDSPAEVNTRTSTPASGMVSPA